MLDKPGYNFPLRSGKTIPRPKTTLPSPREVGRASALGPNRGRPPTPRAAAAAKHKDPPAGAGPTSSDPDDPSATAHGDTAEDPGDGKCAPTSPYRDPRPYSVAGVGALTLAMSVPDDDTLAIQVLGWLLMPPPTMAHTAQSSTFCFPVTFGETADAFLALKDPTASELWTVLQVRVHTHGADACVHRLRRVLGHKFTASEASTLYSFMKFPVS